MQIEALRQTLAAEDAKVEAKLAKVREMGELIERPLFEPAPPALAPAP